MRLSLTLEADTINVLALNMGRVSVDTDGIELTILINVVCDNGCTLQIADESGKAIVESPLPPVRHYKGSAAVLHISPKLTTACCLLFRTSMRILASRNGFIIQAPVT